MGGGSTNTTQQSSSTSQSQLPPWVNQASEQNYAYAQNVANRPLQQYQGQMVADTAPQTQQAWDLAANSGGAGAEQYQGSEAGYLGALGQAAPQIANQNLSPYMNPYTSSVINQTLPLMQQQLALASQGVGSGAAGANAFGGSRQGVQQGVTNAQGALNMGQMAAQLNQANFGQAQAAAGQDVSAQQAKINSDIAAAGGMSNLGQQAQMNQTRQFSELVSAGALEQQQAQNQINANMSKFAQAWQYPQQQMGTLLSALGMTPYGNTTQSSSTGSSSQSTTPDYAMTALGGLQTLGGLFSAPAGGTSAATGLAALLSGSDRRMKTDITKVDTHPSGLPVYAYRYKGDPKSYPKVVGPMAEDVAKVAPHAVRPLGVGGRLGVDMGALDAATGAGGPPLMGPTPGIPSAGPRGAPQGGGPLPGALSAPAPVGSVGALGATLRPPKPRRAGRGLGMARGALAFG